MGVGFYYKFECITDTYSLIIYNYINDYVMEVEQLVNIITGGVYIVGKENKDCNGNRYELLLPKRENTIKCIFTNSGCS